MCEVLIDDFSLLNARTNFPDVFIQTMGSEKGFDYGSTEAVHRVVKSLLKYAQISRIDDWSPRDQVIPIRIKGANQAAIGNMAALMRLALGNPKRLRIVPCDGWGAPAWCRIEMAQMEPITNDRALSSESPFADFTIKLRTEAWFHSTELYTSVADPLIEPDVIWDVDVDLNTGWVASGGTIAYSAGNYVGVNSDASGGTTDKLTKAGLVWDALPYTLMRVEWTCNDVDGGVGEGPPYPYVEVPDGPYLGVGINRVDMGSGWFQETFRLVDGLTAANAGIRVALGGAAGDTDLKIRKITLVASTEAGAYQDLWFVMPGSAPTATTIQLEGDTQASLLLYTCPNLPETTQMPIIYGDAAGPLWPAGIYHLVIRFGTVGAVTGLHWEVLGETFDGSNVIQSGDVDIADMAGSAPDGGSQWVVLANDIILPAQALPPGQLAEASISITKIGGTSIDVDDALLLWMGDPLTGENSPAYTLLDVQPGRTFVRIEAPSPERPVWGVFGGSDVDELYQEQRAILEVGRHDIRPGESRVFLALAAADESEVTITAEAYPAWDYLVPPESRWPTA